MAEHIVTVPVEIQDLIDRPQEALHVELKEWVVLADPAVRAKIARHLAALANHGGGYLVFGFRDDGTLATSQPSDLTPFDHDQFTGIIDRYLVPAFQCDVFIAAPTSGGGRCIVVRIPSHGTVPICAKANGPDDGRGRPQGTRKGEYYVRAPGPKSVAIETPEQWRGVIHRCVLHERQSLLESFSRLLRPLEQSSQPVEAVLKDWHESMHQRFAGWLRDA